MYVNFLSRRRLAKKMMLFQSSTLMIDTGDDDNDKNFIK